MTIAATYPAAAQAAVRAIEDMWKTRSAIDFSQRRVVATHRVENDFSRRTGFILRPGSHKV